MQGFEYRVTAAPRRGVKAKGVRTAEDRFVRAVEGEMNRMATEGWDYVRSDILPCEERQGWFRGTTTVYRTLLVFRRALRAEVTAGIVASDHALLSASPPPVAPLAATSEPWPEPLTEPLTEPRPAPRIEPRLAPRMEPRPMPMAEPAPRPQPSRPMAPVLAPLPPRRTTPPVAPLPEAPTPAAPRRGSLDDLLAGTEPAPRLDR